MLEHFVQKLQHGAELTDEDRRVLERAAGEIKTFGPRQDLIREGDQPDYVHLVLEGFACRYKLLPDGERQIMAYLVPGDICDLHITILGEMDHSIGTLSACKIACLPRAAVEDLTENHGRINRALWWASLVDEAILREWLVGMGRRSADKQMAHLFCELFLRLQAVGLVTDNSYELPLTQDELGDTLGLSGMHVNRVLQQLRSENMIVFKGKRLTISNVRGLQAFAEFNPNYLHLNQGHLNRNPKRNHEGGEASANGK